MTESLHALDRRPRIAVINDDTTYLQLMYELLDQVEGYDVKVCKAWDDAYGLVKRSLPDLVLLDIVMDGEERGWLILQLLTLDPATRPIPVIVCSAAIRSLHEHEPLLQQYGVEVLAKPFDLAALLRKIHDTLGKYRG
jgi:CheY-like chemotaxis protein